MSQRVVFMGTPEFSVPALEALLAAPFDVVGVFTQPDRPKGRGGKVQQSPVKVCALAHGIPVFQPLKIRADGLEALCELAPDYCVTAAFGQILSQAVLDVPRLGTINVHASLLPRHRGAAPVQWALLQGDPVTGVTTMRTDKGIDTGDMLLKRELPIEHDDTAGSLLQKLSHIGAELLIETLRALEAGTCTREAQNEALSTYDPMLKKEMGLLDFAQGTQPSINRVRAMNPWPCAYVPLKEGVLKIWRAKAANDWACAKPAGTVLCADRQNGLIIATSDGAMELCEIQTPNAKRMDARAFLLGHTIETGTLLGEGLL
ncbi:MAG: methionyl-tRNA formyltransferase [Clostridia bacterium]